MKRICKTAGMSQLVRMVPVVVAMLSCACVEQVPRESCYLQSQWFAKDYPNWTILDDHDYDFCGVHSLTDLDLPQELDGLALRSFKVCEELPSDGECQFCPAEEIDARVKVALDVERERVRVAQLEVGNDAGSEACVEPIARFERGCVIAPENRPPIQIVPPPPPTCCYAVWVWTNCLLGLEPGRD